MNVLAHTNRVDYGRMLMPDDGWRTSWAVGTTYSLDLEVLMGIPLALFHGKYLSETTDLRNLRTDMLDALNKVRERLFVFVHENNIYAKYDYSMLMGFLDQNIWNIPLDKVTRNFHPKVWLVRYENMQHPDDYRYRLVVMSRNMTKATDFDIAVSMDGYPTEEQEDNGSLIRMMKALMERTDGKDVSRQLGRELKTVRFYAPSPFDTKPMQFYPHTFRQDISPLLASGKYSELLVISPFIDSWTLGYLAGKMDPRSDARPILVSREYEMDAISPEILGKWDCYQWNSMLEEAENYEECEEEQSAEDSWGRSISLHAKIFIAKARLGRDKTEWNNWFVGSTNGTQAGLKDNYEAQVLLRSSHEETSPQGVLESLQNPDACLITPYTVKSEAVKNDEKEQERLFRKITYAISHLTLVGAFDVVSADKYATRVAVNRYEWETFCQTYPNVGVVISLFCNPGEQWLLSDSHEHTFASISCQHVSPFVRVVVTMNGKDKPFLLKLPFEVPMERHGRMMAEILDSQEKLMRYLLFCLDDRLETEMQKIGSELNTRKPSGGSGNMDALTLPIYERLLLAASRDQAALGHIKKNVERLKGVKGRNGEPLLSKEFMEMWEKFSVYAK